MIPDPLRRPLQRALAPPVRVRVESAKVDALQRELRVKVSAVAARIEPVGGALDVEPAFAAPRDEVVGVDALDVGGHLGNPGGENFGGAAALATGEVASRVGAAAGLVGELPAEDSWGVLVSGDHLLDVALEGGLDAGLGVELARLEVGGEGGCRGGTYIIVILAAEVDGVDVHAAVVGPVVGQGDEEFCAHLDGGVDDLVEGGDIDLGCSVGVPPLKYNVGRTGALVSVAGQASGNSSAVLFVEAPGPEDAQAGIRCGGEALFDICLVLLTVE